MAGVGVMAVVMYRYWEPPGGPARILGGLLGVIGGELAAGGDGLCPTNGSVSAALVDVALGYEAGDRRVPVELAACHIGVHGPGWLLPVAIVQPDLAGRTAAALELALTAETDSSSLPALVTYVELAAELLDGQPPEAAILAATGQVPPVGAPLRLSGDTAADAIAVGVWLLCHRRSRNGERNSEPGDLIEQLASNSTPGAVSAAAGLLGLHAGAGIWPKTWHNGPTASTCRRLVLGLLRARGPRVRATVPRRDNAAASAEVRRTQPRTS